MKMKKMSMILIVTVFMVLSTLTVSLLISENASAHPPAALYLTYKEGTLTVYIDHPSDDPNTHYIESVTVTVNRVEVLSESYTTQTVDDKGKGMVTYSYTVSTSDGDVISVTAVCSIEGSITETLTVGSGDDKDDPKDEPKGELLLISGMVTDTKTKDPIVGAIVSVYNKDNKEIYYKDQTYQRGYYEVEVPAGEYTISISMTGYVSSRESVSITESLEHNVKLTQGSDSDSKDIDDKEKDNTIKEDDPDQKGDSNQEERDLELLLGAIIGVLIVIIILIALLLKKKKGSQEKGAAKKDKIKKDEWTECPKCGSSIRMVKLPAHLDTVHPKLTKKTKDKMIERITKRD
jgi:hypothetical protein